MNITSNDYIQRLRFSIPTFSFPLTGTALTLSSGWLVILPFVLWALAATYVPIQGIFLSPREVWFVSVLVVVLCGASLFGHTLAHIGMARATQTRIPACIPLYPIGDAAQIWPAARTAPREALNALAGPLSNILFAALAYLIWDAQIHPYLNVATPFILFFNAGVALINCIPAFPLDGGRLVRAIVWGLLLRPMTTTRLSLNLGYGLVAALAGWSLFLFAQRARFSLTTGAFTLSFAGLLLWMLRAHQAWKWERQAPVVPLPSCLGVAYYLRAMLAGFLLLTLAGLTVGLAPTNAGMELPGVTPPVAPMIEMPPEYRQPIEGRFILTTVIRQTPILAAQWAMGHLSRAFRILPPEQIVPPTTTLQEIAARKYRLLEESELTALVVGLRLAGYPAEPLGRGARIVAIAPESPAYEKLRVGDIIVSLNGERVRMPGDINDLLTELDAGTEIWLTVIREDDVLNFILPLLPPLEPGAVPHIGVGIASAGFDVNLPIPIRIVPQKISGGPSAGLMFTLTIYDLLTPADLTGGRTIAGTGAIRLDGTVGPIGGVRQKVVGAELSGAEYFFAPVENYTDAAAAARRIQVVEIARAEEAIEFLQNLPPVAASR